jgi:sigma-54 dependent transcriptional regulator, flagellar regulatory protein
MYDMTIGVVSRDSERSRQLTWLLESLGVRSLQMDDADLIFAIGSGNDEWPDTPAARVPVIDVGCSSAGHYPTSLHALNWPPSFDDLQSALHAGCSFLRQQAFSRGEDFGALKEIVGISPNILAVREQVAKVAASNATVLITGESGTGKEVVARALHRHSNRSNGPFVPVNCGAIPADLLESELFGHERGAFTGAISEKAGRFELANGGTLFLDEIGDMPLSMQVKVLRALQDRCFERVGGNETRHTDVRILAATHRSLEVMIQEGSFREDLYYRLNVFPIELAPLRERTEDLPLLVQAMCSAIAGEQALQVRLTVDALHTLAAYSWPGNIRELKNLLERLAIQYPNELVATADLPAKYRDEAPVGVVEEAGQPGDADGMTVALLPVNGLDLKEYLAQLERSLIEQALEDTNSVVARAADRLHIRRTTLVEKMRKYGIERA